MFSGEAIRSHLQAACIFPTGQENARPLFLAQAYQIVPAHRPPNFPCCVSRFHAGCVLRPRIKQNGVLRFRPAAIARHSVRENPDHARCAGWRLRCRTAANSTVQSCNWRGQGETERSRNPPPQTEASKVQFLFRIKLFFEREPSPLPNLRFSAQVRSPAR